MRMLRFLLWSLTLLLVLRSVDRLFMETPSRIGWLSAQTIHDIPSTAGELPGFRFLPNSVKWPPAAINIRSKPLPGLWLGLAGLENNEPVLWIGSGTEPFPEHIQTIQGCIGNRATCDEHWFALSAPKPSGGVLYLLTRLEPKMATLILEGIIKEDAETR